MRILTKAMLGLVPLAWLWAPVASAAQLSWKQACTGPEHVCSASKADSASKTTALTKAKSKVAKAKAKAPADFASDEDKPVKKTKKIAKAKAKPQHEVAEVKPKKKVIAKAKAQDDDENDKPVKKSASKKKVIAKAKPQDDDEDEKPVKKSASKKNKGGDDDGGSVYETGVASWYGGNFNGRKTANGETYDMWEMTAAHKSLPFGTRVKVTNTKTGDSTIVRINDRGPFVGGRVIDLSRAAANDINMGGLAPVKLTILGKG